MDYNDIKETINKIKGTSFAGIDTMVDVKLFGGKKNPMQGRVTKLTEDSNVIVFSNVEHSPYEAMVKRRMLAEGKDPAEFTVGKRAWGSRVDRSPFIEHNGKYYLEVIFKNSGKSSYFLDGNPIEKEMIEGLENPKQKESDEDEEDKAQGGISEKVIVRTYSLDSIKGLRVMGETFKTK